MNTQIEEFTQHMIRQNELQRKQFNIPYPSLPINESIQQDEIKQNEQSDQSDKTQHQEDTTQPIQSKPTKKFTFKKK